MVEERAPDQALCIACGTRKFVLVANYVETHAVLLFSAGFSFQLEVFAWCCARKALVVLSKFSAFGTHYRADPILSAFTRRQFFGPVWAYLAELAVTDLAERNVIACTDAIHIVKAIRNLNFIGAAGRAGLA